MISKHASTIDRFMIGIVIAGVLVLLAVLLLLLKGI
jgi:hypothetical protein